MPGTWWEQTLQRLSQFCYKLCAGSGGGSSGGEAWNMGGMQQNLPDPSRKKSPEDFLGANANLVNLDQLVAKAPPKGQSAACIVWL